MGQEIFPVMRGGVGMGQEKSMRGGDEDPILRPRSAPLPSLGPSIKEPIVEVKALDIEVEEYTPERESTPVNLRVETRSMSRTASPLTPPEVHFLISRNDEVSTSKKP